MRPIRLMIVDDSLVARTMMTRILEGRAEFEVVATASDGAKALDLAGRVTVDIILLDLEMPGLDGLSALPALLARSGGARVLVISASTADGATATVRALTQGAADTLLKPAAAAFAGRFADTLIDCLLRIGHAPLAAATAAAPTPLLPTLPPGRARPAPLECIALGGSTGGPHAFGALFSALPDWVTAPILVTQHLPAVFMPYFARQLQDIARRPTRVAENGARLRNGEVLIAPGDGHLRLARNGGQLVVRIDRAPVAAGYMPSVDAMLASIADTLGAAAIGVVLSGMGRDGLIGAGLLVQSGGEVAVQDVATSVVWGMPGAIAKAGLAAAILPPDAIAGWIGERVRPRAVAGAWR